MITIRQLMSRPPTVGTRILKTPSPVPQPQSRGLGDTVAKVTHAMGIKPCGGCKQRQEYLNKAFPYRES